MDGFTNGFDIGYEGPVIRQDKVDNIPLRIGNKIILWNKIMKEVKLCRYMGPFAQIPFDNYMQSPIGLVPKSGNKVRLIFHLSYQFDSGLGSLNSNTPPEKCSVKYKDLDHAMKCCLQLLKKLEDDGLMNQTLVFAKSDLTSAFRILGLKRSCFQWLVMKAVDPKTGQTVYFVDKCLPFGASISCTLFQAFSDALQHITLFFINQNQMDVLTNYLDDFLFIAFSVYYCNKQVHIFLDICKQIDCPVSEEKTKWATTIIVFLGVLMDGKHECLSIPVEKRIKAMNVLKWFIENKKATIKQIQVLTGLLNFLSKALIPGRAFTRRMYAKVCTQDKKGNPLKDHHHVKIDEEFKHDCSVWLTFLEKEESNQQMLCRPFIDIDTFQTVKTLNFYSDASGKIGFGAVFEKRWLHELWNSKFWKKIQVSNTKSYLAYALQYSHGKNS